MSLTRWVCWFPVNVVKSAKMLKVRVDLFNCLIVGRRWLVCVRLSFNSLLSHQSMNFCSTLTNICWNERLLIEIRTKQKCRCTRKRHRRKSISSNQQMKNLFRWNCARWDRHCLCLHFNFSFDFCRKANREREEWNVRWSCHCSTRHSGQTMKISVERERIPSIKCKFECGNSSLNLLVETETKTWCYFIRTSSWGCPLTLITLIKISSLGLNPCENFSLGILLNNPIC